MDVSGVWALLAPSVLALLCTVITTYYVLCIRERGQHTISEVTQLRGNARLEAILAREDRFSGVRS